MNMRKQDPMLNRNKLIYVQFDLNHNRVIPLGNSGISIIRADKWLHKEQDGATTFENNKNGLETTPQICTVLNDNPNFPYKIGDKVFVNYMATELSQYADIESGTAYILAEYIFFTILPDGTIQMADGVYMGEQIYTEEIITAGGIFLGGGNKDTLKVRITHLPSDARGVEVGDVVASIDSYNYEFSYEGKKYIKLAKHEIAGVLIDEVPGIKPLAL